MTQNDGQQVGHIEPDAQLIGSWLEASSSPTDVNALKSGGVQKLEEQDRRQRLQKYRPTVPKKIGSWLSTGLGLVFLLGAFLPSPEGITWAEGFFTGICCAVVLGLPGVFWLWNDRRDRKKIEHWVRANAEYSHQLSLLSEEDRNLLSEPDKLPLLPKRPWLVVWAIVAVAFVLVGIFAPDVATTG